jgi:cytochrome c556
MRAWRTIAVVAILGLGLSPGLAAGPDAVDPADAIAARKAAMESIERLLAQLEADKANALLSPDQLVVSTEAIATLLDTFPLLFPTSTDLLGTGASIEGVATSADPRIWQEFEAFAALSANAARTARNSIHGDPDRAMDAMRATCTACHATYLYYDPFATPAK